MPSGRRRRLFLVTISLDPILFTTTVLSTYLRKVSTTPHYVRMTSNDTSAPDNTSVTSGHTVPNFETTVVVSSKNHQNSPQSPTPTVININST